MRAIIKETLHATFILSPVIVLCFFSAMALRGNHYGEKKAGHAKHEKINTVCRIVSPAGYTVFL